MFEGRITYVGGGAKRAYDGAADGSPGKAAKLSDSGVDGKADDEKKPPKDVVIGRRGQLVKLCGQGIQRFRVFGNLLCSPCHFGQKAP